MPPIKLPTKAFTFSVKLFSVITVNAVTEQAARALLTEHCGTMDCNGGAWPNGDPILFEAGLDDGEDELIAIDGEHPDDVLPKHPDDALPVKSFDVTFTRDAVETLTMAVSARSPDEAAAIATKRCTVEGMRWEIAASGPAREARVPDQISGDVVWVHVNDANLDPLWLVSLTWDDWPEGGSFTTKVHSPDHDQAVNAARWQMAVARAKERGDGTAPIDMLEAFGDEWHVVNCFEVADLMDEWSSSEAAPIELQLHLFTVWVANKNGRGTHFVATFKALAATDAKQQAIEACSASWGTPPSDLRVMGVASGNIELLEWDGEEA